MLTHNDNVDFIDRGGIIEKIKGQFAQLDPNYAMIKAAFWNEINLLGKQLQSLQESRNPAWRSQQIISEAIWLCNYTCDWLRLRVTINDLRRSLEPVEQRADDQLNLVPSDDGGYHHGSYEFHVVLDLTTDAVQRDDAPKTTLRFLMPYLSVGKLLDYLWRLQITDISQHGVNYRDELGSVESSFSQFFFKCKLRRMLRDPKLWPGCTPDDIASRLTKLSETYADFLSQTQHPRTGYWGPWYRIDGELLQLHDLSFTFHVVNFRRGHVDCWPEIIETTLEIGRRGLVYPYGWKPSDNPSPYSNHHNTDVVTLFKFGFQRPGINDGQRQQMADIIYKMLDWCLTESLMSERDAPYCGFRELDEYNTIQKFSFGVGFLKLVGFFDLNMPFWWNSKLARKPCWPHPCRVADGLLRAVNKLNVDSSFTDDIRGDLEPIVSGPECKEILSSNSELS